MTTLPTELIRNIVMTYMDDQFFERCATQEGLPDLFIKPQWSLVEPLSIVSHAFRTITMESWFRVVVIPDSPSGDKSELLQDIYRWARKVRWDAHDFVLDDSRLSVLSLFPNLRGLQINAMYLRVDATDTPLITLEELGLRGVGDLHPHMLSNVARMFPGLQTISLVSRRTWCGYCNLSIAMPIGEACGPITYTDSAGLPTLQARALANLERLRTVRIVLLGTPSINMIPHGEISLLSRWTGECAQCCNDLVYGREAEREGWLASKAGKPSPPALSLVEWYIQEDDKLQGSEVDDFEHYWQDEPFDDGGFWEVGAGYDEETDEDSDAE